MEYTHACTRRMSRSCSKYPKAAHNNTYSNISKIKFWIENCIKILYQDLIT